MPYKAIKLAKKLNDLQKHVKEFTPGQFADALVKVFKDVYVDAEKNLSELEKQVEVVYKRVKTFADVVKSQAAAAVAAQDPNILDQLETRAQNAAAGVAGAEAQDDQCRVAMADVMVNLQSPIEVACKVNAAAQAEGKKMVKFLGAVEPRIIKQTQRCKEMRDLLKQCALHVAQGRKQLGVAAAADFQEATKDLTEMLKNVEKRANTILNQSIYQLELHAGLPAEKFTEQVMKMLKRCIADGHNTLDAFDSALETIRLAVKNLTSGASRANRDKADVAAYSGYLMKAEAVAKAVYEKTAVYLDDRFLFEINAKHKAYLGAHQPSTSGS